MIHENARRIFSNSPFVILSSRVFRESGFCMVA
jgi:hypothetical protein